MASSEHPIDRHRRLATALGRERYVAQNPSCFLFRPPAANATASDWDDPFSFATRVAQAPELDEDGPERAGAPVLASITKREDGPFPDRIGVGRARNCDVVLRFPSVSKLHAQFRFDDEKRLVLVDLGSANGTYVEGVRLVPRAQHPVVIGARLAFGQEEVALVDADRLFDLLTKP